MPVHHPLGFKQNILEDAGSFIHVFLRVQTAVVSNIIKPPNVKKSRVFQLLAFHLFEDKQHEYP